VIPRTTTLKPPISTKKSPPFGFVNQEKQHLQSLRKTLLLQNPPDLTQTIEHTNNTSDFMLKLADNSTAHAERVKREFAMSTLVEEPP
jgi:hypothetical protein